MNYEKTGEEKIQMTEMEELEDPTPVKMPTEERIRIFANIIVDRILDLQKSVSVQREVNIV